MKQLFAYICFLIFSFQVIPVKEIGKLLYKSQLSEEVNDSSPVSDDDVLKLKKDSDPYIYSDHAQTCAHVDLLAQQVNTAIEEAERLPQNHAADVFSPPPDRA